MQIRTTMKRLLQILLVLSSYLSYGQEYVTDYPSVSSSNCSYCRIAKMIVSSDQTKVLIELTGQRGISPWVSFSRWTVLLPYNSYINLSELREFDLNMPEPKLTDATYVNLWLRLAEKKKAMQEETIKTLGNSLIKSLGNDKLDTKYNH